MKSGNEVLDAYYPEMRWRVLSLAADIDRIQRNTGGDKVLAHDARVNALKACINELLSHESGRAERVQMILSDRTKM